MSDDVVDGEKCTLVAHTFNTVEVLTIEYDGRAVLLAQQVGEALGYADPAKLANNIIQKWADDFEEGRDFIKLTNGRLAAFKAAVNCRPDRAAVDDNHRPDRAVVDPRTPNLILLTESGAQLAAILSRTPQGRAFRRWLVDVVLPERQKTSMAKSRPAHTPSPKPSGRKRRQMDGGASYPLLGAPQSLKDFDQRMLIDCERRRWVARYDIEGGMEHPFIGVREHLISRIWSYVQEYRVTTWRDEVIQGVADAMNLKLATFDGDPLLERAKAHGWFQDVQVKELLDRMDNLQLIRALAMIGRSAGVFAVICETSIAVEGWRWSRGPDPRKENAVLRMELERAKHELEKLQQHYEIYPTSAHKA